jgi:hypothetical protein
VCAKFARLLDMVAHDAFRVHGTGLPLSAALVLHELPCRTAEELRKTTGLSLRTIRSAFAALQAEELIEKSADTGDWVRTAETLDAVAERRGTAGASERQVKLHVWQRAVYSTLMRSAASQSAPIAPIHNLSEDERQPSDPLWEEDITWRNAA